MGNKIAASGSQNLRPTGRPSSLQRRSSQRDGGSSESLCTFFSLDSHSDQCLLKEQDCNNKTKPRAQHEPRTACGRTPDESSLFQDDDDGTSTIITTLEDIISNDMEREKENSVADQNNEMGNFKIPESLLQKLTTKDWNDLVQFICSSMEQSLQSNILNEIERLREKNSHLSTDSNEATIDDEKRDEKPVSPLDTIPTSPTRRTNHRRSHNRPLSMPSVSSSQLINNEIKHKNHHVGSKHNHHRDSSKSPPLVIDSRQTNELDVSNSKTKIRSSSNPHKVHFTDEARFKSSGVWRSCSGSSLDELDLNSKHKYLKKGHSHNSRGYLTLDQLKALGLSLQQDSTKLTSERLSSFSMKCWHGDVHNNHSKGIASSSATATTGQKRSTKRRHRKRSMKHKHNDIHVKSSDNQKPQFEQLCLLGPNDITSESTTPIPSTSSPAPLPVTDNDESKQLDQDGDHSGDNNSGTCSSDDSMVTAVPADVKVEHLHQHNHHHYHHFIHHSISQPSGLCDSGKTTTVQYALSTRSY